MTKIKGLITLVLRLIALATAVVATIVMGTAHDSASVMGFNFEAKFTNSPSFKYFVVVYAIASCYSLAVLVIPFKNMLWRLILILDTVMTVVLTSGLSAALAIAYVGKKGNSNAGWLPICGQVPKFCDQTTAAFALGFVAAFFYLLLLLYSLHASLTPLFVDTSST